MTGTRNTALGAYSLYDITSGNYNTAVGVNSLNELTTGEWNCALGIQSLYESTTGSRNVAIGSNAARNNITGQGITAVGNTAFYTDKAGSYSTAIGFQSQYWGNTSTTSYTTYNTSVGAYSMMGRESAPLTGTKNTAVGYSAAEEMNTGEENVAVGHWALQYTTEGSYNTALGAYSLSSSDAANRNTAVGCAALYETTTGESNTAIGMNSFRLNKGGSFQVGVGLNAGYNTTTGGRNTAIGTDALYYNTTGADNTAIGIGGGKGIRGSYNTAVGGFAMEADVNYSWSTAVGYRALNQCKSNSNTAVGADSLRYCNNSDQSENTAIGTCAGRGLSSAKYSTFVGAYSGDTGWGNYNNCTLLGNGTAADADNQVLLGNSSTTTYYWNLQQASDLRDKTDVRDTILGLEFIKALRPVDYRWDYRVDYHEYDDDRKRTTTLEEAYARKDGSKKRTRFHHGLIAQEVKEVADAQGVDFAGYQDHKIIGGKDTLTLGYHELIAPLIKAVQELSAENEALKARLDAAGL